MPTIVAEDFNLLNIFNVFNLYLLVASEYIIDKLSDLHLNYIYLSIAVIFCEKVKREY
jgi:hypothetical protein